MASTSSGRRLPIISNWGDADAFFGDPHFAKQGIFFGLGNTGTVGVAISQGGFQRVDLWNDLGSNGCYDKDWNATLFGHGNQRPNLELDKDQDRRVDVVQLTLATE